MPSKNGRHNSETLKKLGKLTAKDIIFSRLSGIEAAHQELKKLVNELVLPNLQDLQKLASQVLKTNPIILKHSIYMDIIIRKLDISEQDYKEAEDRIRNRATQDSESVRIQSKEAGTDEGRGSDGQPRVLDAPVGGVDDAGSGNLPDGNGRDGQAEAPEATGTVDPAAGTGEGEADIVIQKAAQLGSPNAQKNMLRHQLGLDEEE